MSRHAPLGTFEYFVLLAVLQLGDGAYAVPVRAEVERRMGRAVARGALYTTLARLEEKGCLRSRMGDPTPERGGKAKRYYAVSASGLRALRATHAWIAQSSRGLGRLLGDAP